MKLAPHFTKEELIFSSTAARLGIDNEPPPEILPNLIVLAEGLEKVRVLLGNPMHIDSGYRCVALNNRVGGARKSAHLVGYAADFTCAAFGTPLDICRVVYKSSIRFDQCICEGAWVHISFAPSMRQEVLTAQFANGVATYTHGLS